MLPLDFVRLVLQLPHLLRVVTVSDLMQGNCALVLWKNLLHEEGAHSSQVADGHTHSRLRSRTVKQLSSPAPFWLSLALSGSSSLARNPYQWPTDSLFESVEVKRVRLAIAPTVLHVKVGRAAKVCKDAENIRDDVGRVVVRLYGGACSSGLANERGATPFA